MVVTDDEAVATTVRSLRSHAMTSVTWDRHRGHAESYDILDVGFNYRIDEPRAALGLSRLPRLEADLEKRRTMVRAYRSALSGVDGVLVPWEDEEVERSTHFVFGIVLDDEATRDRVRTGLAGRGIQTTAYPCISQFTEYADGVRLPVAESIAARHTALPPLLLVRRGRGQAGRGCTPRRARLTLGAGERGAVPHPPAPRDDPLRSRGGTGSRWRSKSSCACS